MMFLYELSFYFSHVILLYRIIISHAVFTPVKDISFQQDGILIYFSSSSNLYVTVTLLHLAKEKMDLFLDRKHLFLHTGVFQMIVLKIRTRLGQ